MKQYKIVSIDGGGVRGLIAAMLLHRLNTTEEIAGWLDDVDLFAGTSTGGIIALGLAMEKSPEDIAKLYKEKSTIIFQDGIIDFGKILTSDYDNKNLKQELQQIFGDKKLKELKKKVVVPTFDLDNNHHDCQYRTWKPKIFHNFQGKDSDGEHKAVEVAMYTTAAPTYFPTYSGYIDGGVFANNPSIVAIAQAISCRNSCEERVTLDQISLLSVGTGISNTYIKGERLHWGYIQWAKPLINILMDGVSSISDYQAQQLLQERYHRLQITFSPKDFIPMDASNQIEKIEQSASNYHIDNEVKWLKNLIGHKLEKKYAP